MSIEAPANRQAVGDDAGVAVARRRKDPLSLALLGLLWVYRAVISPVLPPNCRFYPSCSAYAVEAIGVHGPLRGTGLAAWRLLRCGPWHPGGVDPVPPRRERPAREGSAVPDDPDRMSATGAEE
jgi:putative membrane protein insertion efficiency factor